MVFEQINTEADILYYQTVVYQSISLGKNKSLKNEGAGVMNIYYKSSAEG